MKYDYFIEELKSKGIVPGLDAIRTLLKELGNPQDDLKICHIAGTNGKGSVFAYLSYILMEEGLRVGRYVSPTISSYEERFQINGIFIDKETLEELYGIIEEAVRRIEARGEQGPTLFEAETALAFLYFRKENVDYALIECGMGGLYDATNVITHPVLSVIASISFDHMAVLGNSLEEIAFQKAGIIKDRVPVVLSENKEEVLRVVLGQAQCHHAPLMTFSQKDYEILQERYDGMVFRFEDEVYETALPGLVQVPNAITAILAARVLQLSEPAIKKGIKNTRWPGRLELLSKNPLIYRDGAHNPDAACKLSQFLKDQFSSKRIHLCLGILKDKDYSEILGYLLPVGYRIYAFTPQNARGLDGNCLAQAIRLRKPDADVKVYATVNDALKSAKDHAGSDDVIVVCGSLSFMEEMEEELWS